MVKYGTFKLKYNLMVKLKNKKLIYSIAITAFLILVVYLAWPQSETSSPKPVPKNRAVTPVDTMSSAAFHKSKYSVNSASSLWAVVNKGRILPADYNPSGLVTPNVLLGKSRGSAEMMVRQDTAVALEEMFAAAKNSGIKLMLTSGYRAYSVQTAVYSRYVAESGAAQADTFSARPGHSEHQTGLAADLEPSNRTCELDYCFADTPEGKWLAVNAYKYGFIIRYQKDKESLTGYTFEPWHIRYVGNDLAEEINKTNQTLEQFFSLPVYTNYPPSSYELSGS
jgi:D-alanyl-D-alanine carboxypeptidase